MTLPVLFHHTNVTPIGISSIRPEYLVSRQCERDNGVEDEAALRRYEPDFFPGTFLPVDSHRGERGERMVGEVGPVTRGMGFRLVRNGRE